MRSPASAPRIVSPALLLAVAALAAATLSANLIHLAHSQGCRASLRGCALGDGPWAQRDSIGYLRLARQIRSDGLASIDFDRRTPGYPLLLAASLSLTGAVTPALWLAVPAGALAATSLAWLAGAIGGTRRAALATGLLFATSFSVLALAPMLLTDALHGFLAAVGLATALAWRRSERWGWAAASALAWMAAQSLRPTFFPVALLLGLLLFSRHATRRRNAISAALCGATLLLPLAIVTSNWVRLGLASPSVKLAYAAACESVPELKRRLGVSSHRAAREECRQRQRGLTPRERVRAQNAEAARFFAAYPIETARMLLGSLGEQLLFPTRIAHREEYAHLYPGWAVMGSHALALYWIVALTGTLLLWRSDRPLALFIIGSFALVMLPASLIHTGGARYRFPAELLLLPVAVACVDRGATGISSRWKRA